MDAIKYATLYIDPGLLETIDVARGQVSRSLYIEMLLKSHPGLVKVRDEHKHQWTARGAAKRPPKPAKSSRRQR